MIRKLFVFDSTTNRRRRYFISFVRHISIIAIAFAATAAYAEKADRDKPINFRGDTGDVDLQTNSGTLVGNATLTQGTITIQADRILFKQNPDNSLSATAFGNPVSFRQKRDGVDEYYEGYAQRAVYDGAKEVLELFDRALLKRTQDEIRSNYISYNAATEFFKAEGRPATKGSPDEGPLAGRVRGVFQPRAKDKDKDKDKDKNSTSGTAAPKSAASPSANPPLTLKPAGAIPPIAQ